MLNTLNKIFTCWKMWKNQKGQFWILLIFLIFKIKKNITYICMFFSWSGKLPLWIQTCNLIYNILSSNMFFFSFVTTDDNLFVWLIFFIIPFNLKTRVAWSRDLTWFDTNIILFLYSDSCFFFKLTHTFLSDTYFRWHYFCFVK